MNEKFYICSRCGNVITKLTDSGVTPHCCGEKMNELVAGTVEDSREKHIPVYELNGTLVKVNVGSVDHPMIPEHFIEWVVIYTNLGYQVKHLLPNSKPNVSFELLDDETLVSVYAYCNLHGLWKTN